jgi:Domain of unknown function (DUF6265)
VIGGLSRMRAEKVLRISPALILLIIPMALLARASQPIRQGKAASFSFAHSFAQSSKNGAPTQSSGPADPSAAKLTDFAWLEGRWRGEWGPRVAEQVWLAPKASAMEGMFRLIEADKTLVIEFFTLVQKPDGIAFYFRHFTATLAPWEKSEATLLNLVTIDGKKSVFENPVNGMPKSATLTRIDADTYVSRSELIPETGDPQAIEITYKRQPALTPAVNAGSGAHPKKP